MTTVAVCPVLKRQCSSGMWSKFMPYMPVRWRDVSLPLNRRWPVPEITPVASRDNLDLVGEG